MKPKPFRLGRVLEVRRRQQRQRQKELAQAAQRLRRQEDRVIGILNERLACREAIAARERAAAAAHAPLDVLEARRSRQVLVQLARQAGQESVPLPALRETTEARRQELVTARLKVRVLENLRDRCDDALRRWLRRREQTTLDDLANRAAAARAILGRTGRNLGP